MGYQQRDGDISVFKEKNQTNPKAPNWKGSALIDGVQYEVALWAKGDSGTMLAGAIKVARQKTREDIQPQRTHHSDRFDPDESPF